jgi:uncharacterized protein YdeI (YjbR/CyaY-like superfamily)
MGAHLGGTPERPTMFFDAASDFDGWLAEHHASETTLWMGFYKRHAAARGLTYAEAVPIALRWGWIDSTTQRLDADAVRQRWSPRKKRSTWSRMNIAHVERMIAEGTMQPAGLAAYALRTDENSVIYSYEMGEAGLYPEHEARMRSVPAAAAFWDAASPSYRKMCAAWIAQAKTEATRDRRFAALLDDSAAGRLVPPQRYGEVPAWFGRAAEAARATGA